MSSIPTITIDGPAASGKGTIALLLARELNWHYLDSGILYRLLALIADKQNIALDNIKTLADLAENLPVEFDVLHNLGQKPSVKLEGVEIGDEIRSELYAVKASKISVFSEVRIALLARQRAFQKEPGLVTDGRDMGSTIFPEAQLKIFLKASLEERAKRRYAQLRACHLEASLAKLYEDLRLRDQRDENREIAPLTPVQDSVVIDTTGSSIEEVIGRIRGLIREVFDL